MKTFISLSCLFLFPLCALSVDQITPDVFDLSGVWQIENPEIATESDISQCRYLFAEANWAMMGRDWMELDEAGPAEYSVDEFGEYIRFPYQGFYHHHHGFATKEAITGDSTSPFDNWFRYQYDCHIEPLVYEISGYLQINLLTDQITLSLGGNSLSTPVYEYGTRISIGHNLTGDLFDFNSKPDLYESLSGNEINLTVTFSEFQKQVDGIPPGCDLSLLPVIPSTVALAQGGCLIRDYRPLLFTKTPTSPADLGIEGTIKGQLLPDLSSTLRVDHGTVVLRRQDFGLRDRREGESGDEYLAYLDENSTLIQSYTVDEEGYFTFENVPVFRVVQTPTGGKTIVRAQYSVDVVSPYSTATFFETGVLYYKPINVLNYIIPIENSDDDEGNDKMLTIRLEPFEFVAEKYTQITELSNLSPNNYKEIEDEMREYLERFTSGDIQQTDERGEGIRRSILAERVMREGSETSKQMLKIMFEGISKLVGDAFDAFTDFNRADVRRSREVQEARSTVNPEIAARYQLDAEDMARPDSVNFRTTEDMLLVARNDDFFQGMKQVMKVSANLLKQELIFIGVEADTANSVAAWMERISNVMFNLIRTHSASGAASSLIKEAIENLVQEFDSVFFDNSLDIELSDDLKVDFPIEIAPSYNKRTAPFLRFAVDESMQWDESNSAQFLDDLTETTRILNDLIEVGSNLLIRVGYYVAVRDSSDVLQDFFGLIGNVDSRARVVEKIAEVTKYVMSGVLVIEPMLYVYYRGHTRVEDGVYAAFGMEPPQNDTVIVQQTTDDIGEANVRRFDLTSPIASRFEQSLTELIEQLEDNHFGNVIQTIGGDSSTSYLAAYDNLKEHLNQMKLVLASVDLTQLEQNDQLKINDFFEAEAEWIERQAYFISSLEKIVIDVVSMKYEYPSDAQYVALRNHTIHRARGLIVATQELRNTLASALSPLRELKFPPIVSVEISTPRSRATERAIISEQMEEFVISATATNIGTLDVSGLNMQLNVKSPSGAMLVIGNAIASPAGGVLTADDGDDEGGNDEFSFEWTIRYEGQLEEEVFWFEVSLLENNSTPQTFAASSSESYLLVDPVHFDRDLDRLPDEYESAYGLDPDSADDAMQDADGDGLDNLFEYLHGMNINDPDTDQDGKSDYDEVNGVNGFTDPLIADTDDDGQLDSVDESPTDASNQSQLSPGASIGLDQIEVNLTSDQPIATVHVLNIGEGELSWSALSNDDAFASTTPKTPQIRGDGDSLTIYVPSGVDFQQGDLFETTVTVFSIGTGQRNVRDIIVRLGDDLAMANNIEPFAVDDSFETQQRESIVINVTSNDFDFDEDELYVTQVDQSDGGRVSINSSGQIVYSPEDAFFGIDYFAYTVSDGRGGYDRATVKIDVIPQANINAWSIYE